MIPLLIAAACVAFVLSLPISATRAGQTLRRWAGVLFLLALAPSLFMGLFGAMGGSISTPRVTVQNANWAGELLSAAAGLVLLSPVAYGILQLRKRFTKKSRDPWADYVDRKAGGKKVVDPKPAKPVLPSGTFGPFGGAP